MLQRFYKENFFNFVFDKIDKRPMHEYISISLCWGLDKKPQIRN